MKHGATEQRRRKLLLSFLCCSVALCFILINVYVDLRTFPGSLSVDSSSIKQTQFLDRNGEPLSTTYQNQWNVYDQVALADIPLFLQQAFIQAEDRRFYENPGYDVRAIASAFRDSAQQRRLVRGGSTITEQVVRMLHPRPRTLWSRWLELLEAASLTHHFSKSEILEFYLNQVPFASSRRGVAAAAKFFFDRSLSTLSEKEMLALAVMVRHPALLNPRNNSLDATAAREQRIGALAQRMTEVGLLTVDSMAAMKNETLDVHGWMLAANANHFLRYVKTSAMERSRADEGRVRTSLNVTVQQEVQDLLNTRLHQLRAQLVTNGAVLVVENSSNQVLAWANGAAARTSAIDAVVTPRQPGSTLKPFLYALALERGWTPATIIDDSPLAEAVGVGLKEYRNYSGAYYGPIRLREALGNSLNIPAIRTVQTFGRNELHNTLLNFGFTSLSQPTDFYGDGLALGNGEVTLYELVRAYATLARGGVYADLEVLAESGHTTFSAKRIATPEITSLIANMLSDAKARRKEFPGALMNFPAQTAIKTGTSSDYRDAWAVGFSSHYTVGVWLGNLDRAPMIEVSGARGAVLLLRSIFATLEREKDSRALPLSAKLERRDICPVTGKLAGPHCAHSKEWFLPNTAPTEYCDLHANIEPQNKTIAPTPIQIKFPSANLRLAMDPRIPDSLEAFPFVLADGVSAKRTDWYVDNVVVDESLEPNARYLWPLSRGTHAVHALVWPDSDSAPTFTEQVVFHVR